MKLASKDIRKAFSNLDERERTIILDRIQGKTLDETRKDIGLNTVSRMYQVETKAFEHFSRELAFR